VTRRGAVDPIVPARIDAAVERAFAALSGWRGSRIFHPQGIAFRGRVVVEADVRDVAVLAAGAEHRATFRFSRALGTPRGRTDFLGLAFCLGEQQDVLLASSSAVAVGRCLPLPARSFFGTTMTSLLPFRVGGDTAVVGARLQGRPPGVDDQLCADDQLVELERAFAASAVGGVLAIARLAGRWRRVGRFELEERLPDELAQRLRFDPWRCAGGLVPRGSVNNLRAAAYRGSRRGRAARRTTNATSH
jgi:hypothetical protein